MLPPFLQPLPTSHDRDYLNAQFIHGQQLPPSHVLWWPPRATVHAPDVLLLFIPGNPGLVDFYIPYLSSIYHNQQGLNLSILAHAHIDHSPHIQDPSTISPPPQQSLLVQVQGATEAFDHVLSFYPKAKIVVIGHSVGSWISLELLKTRKDHIYGVFFLFPVLSHIANTPNGKRLSPLFTPLSRSILSTICPFTKYIPSFVLRTLYATWPEQQLAALRAFVSSPTCVSAALSMAHEEMLTIKSVDFAFLQEQKKKLWFYYARQDGWVGEEKMTILRTFDPNGTSAQIFHGPSGVPHAFCVSTSHSELLARFSVQWLRDLFEKDT